MKDKISIILFTFLLLSISAINVFAYEGNDEKLPVSTYLNDEIVRVMVGFEDDIDLALLDSIPHKLHYIYEEIRSISVSVPSSVLDELRHSKGIKWVEKDQEVRTDGEVLQISASQITDWGYVATVREELKLYNLTGKGVKIGIIDTGISTSHPDLAVAGGIGLVEGNSSYEDDNGHGTHVAGIIAAQNNDLGILGLAPDSEIYAIKALSANGEGTESSVVAGVQWAIDHNLDIINLSLTTESPTLALQKMLAEAKEQGMIIVASAGNLEEGQVQSTDDILYPARYMSVIGVGSVGRNLTRSVFSYSGPSLDYSAPGEGIYSTYKPVNGKAEMYAKMSGTSMAAPFVTGIIALYKEAFPAFDTESIMNLLNENTIDLGDPKKDNLYGFGLIQTPDTIFFDLENDKWYSPYVMQLISKNYINGFGDGTFRPDAPITRAEAVTMIGTILELNGEKRETKFSDVSSNHYASGFIASASEKNIVSGHPDQTFRPSANISRGDAALIIQKAFNIKKTANHDFEDVALNKYYSDAISALYENHYISGYSSQIFMPDRNISRAEFSTILAKILAS